MQQKDKVRLARELLRARPLFGGPALELKLGKTAPELLDRITREREQAAIALYVQHFSLNQLEALVDFYGSELGQSIAAQQNILDRELGAAMSAIFRQLSKEFTDVSNSPLIESDA